MKNTEEMVNSLFERRDRYNKEQKIRQGRMMRTLRIAGTFCLALLVVFGVWKIAAPGDNNVINTVSAREDDRVMWVENSVCVKIEGLQEWYGKTVAIRLIEEMKNGKEDTIYAILARPHVNYDFEYKGRALKWYYKDMAEERIMPEVLRQLLKDGDALKYGTALYETGIPGGEKWAQSYYEEKIAYYGQEILNKYIVNGEFLKEKLEADIITADNVTEKTVAYRAAYTAYLTSVAESVKGAYPSEVVIKENGIIMYLTEEQFKVFTDDNIRGWTFDLAVKNASDETYGVNE